MLLSMGHSPVTNLSPRFPSAAELKETLVLETRPRHTSRPLVAGAVAGIVILAVVVRFAFVNEVSGDYRNFLSPWYDQLSAGGFSALAGDFSNYNPPYLYLMLLATHLPLPKIVAIKLISIVFDVVLAGFAALIVRERFPRPQFWLSAFALVLFAPTVLINSSWWGQCDSIYASFCLGSLYFLIKRKPWWAAVFFGIALSFKLQAVFFLPVLIIVLVVNRQKLWSLLAAPAVFAALLLPAALAGRDLGSLLMIYPDQVTGGGTAGFGGETPSGQFGGRGAGQGGAGQGGFGPGGVGQGGAGGAGTSLTQNAPTIFQWITGTSTIWRYLGLAVAGIVTLAIAAAAFLRRRELELAQIVVLATTVVLAVPFFLPEMHERYFFLADVLTIVMAFYVRRYWLVAVLVSACSLLSYWPFLWSQNPVALPLVAFAELLAVIVTAVVFVTVVVRGADGPLLRHPAAVRRPELAPADRLSHPGGPPVLG
jgi:Gpi18-like mannosyltransferase